MIPSGEDIKDLTWKWRCKLSGQKKEKSLSDFESESSVIDKEDVDSKPATGKTPINRSKDPEFGGSALVKTLYEGKNSGDNYIDWQDYPPRQVSKSVAKSNDRVAIKVYKVKDKDKPVIGGRFALKYHQIEVQNPLLVAALAPIVKEENVHLDPSEAALFKEPFRPLYFRYDEIVAKARSLDAADPLKPFIRLLIRVLDEAFGGLREKRQQLADMGLVNFKLAWTFFPKDSVVLSHGNNCSMLSKVVDTEYAKKGLVTVLTIRSKVLRFNGDAFIWEEQTLDIPKFGGNRPITELRHYPLEFHPEAADVEAKLKARGQMALDYQGLTYSLYSGIGLHQTPKGHEKHIVDSRILIDTVGYNKHHLAKGVREAHDPEVEKKVVKGTGRRASPDELPTEPLPAGKLRRLSEEEQNKNKQVMLSKPDDLKFMSPLVEGYALKNKLWMSFYVEDIKPMIYNEQAFEHLVYDEQQKDLVLSFVENHGKSRSQLEDVILGKGNGLIILLSGPPGTGKTLTAEAVADRTRRPLFYLQAEDLGINAAALGENIKKVFEMATEWDAVILLDEADVFMAERHPQDIARNELVSIFLRELEYFKGIIFLTTNLYDTIDSAFRSRVSLHLLFKPLSADARLAVWRKFLDRLPRTANVRELKDNEDGAEDKEELDESDLKELSAWNLNGREIKNAVKMVKSWCDQKDYNMNLTRLENGIKVTSPHAAKMTNSNDTDLYD